MATVSRKQLHKHSLPIVMLSLGWLIVSILAVNRLAMVTASSQSSPMQLLSVRLFTIRPTANGLFQIERYKVSDNPASSGISLSSPATGLTGLMDIGKVAELQVMVNGSVK